MTKRYALRDDQWEQIKDLLPGRANTVGVTAKDNSPFVEAVLYRYRLGIPWRDLPERFGDFRVVHTRFSCWAKAGVWQKVFEVLAKNSDNEYAMLDSTIVRAHQHSAGKKEQAIGRSKGGLSTKIHARTDALGNLTGFYLTAGQAHDLNGANVLLDLSLSQTWLMDKAYNSKDRVIDPIHKINGQIVMPSKSNVIDQRDYVQHLYKARHLIENFFTNLKQYRGIVTRYDKLAQNFLSAIYLASIMIWLN
ncbi:IS5 family transposase [Acinetobacter johnsonii]|uniref:IS5 family transposase n=1 Tax=Acinetobacter johnsonii TaxID=40214 RepID=UPI002446E4AB|nr:IS5 family transposase [Acinetobacter johnsonii]MDH1699660.1 IS5 family transposase [Acinetobacter johnsonii]